MGLQVYKSHNGGIFDMQFDNPNGQYYSAGANIIAEEQWGLGADTIEFPNVSSCTTVTCRLDNGRLIGAHFTMSSTESEVDQFLSTMSEEAVASGATITDVRMMGTFESTGTGWLAKKSRYALPAKKTTEAVNKRLGRSSKEKVSVCQLDDGQTYRYSARTEGSTTRYFREPLDQGTGSYGPATELLEQEFALL